MFFNNPLNKVENKNNHIKISIYQKLYALIRYNYTKNVL